MKDRTKKILKVGLEAATWAIPGGAAVKGARIALKVGKAAAKTKVGRTAVNVGAHALNQQRQSIVKNIDRLKGQGYKSGSSALRGAEKAYKKIMEETRKLKR